MRLQRLYMWNNLTLWLLTLCLFVLPLYSMASSSQSHFDEDKRINVIIYTYHSKPPYIIDFDNKKGSYFDVVRHLNAQQGNYQFSLKYIPRKRLDLYLADPMFTGGVIGVKPSWFNDEKQEKFLWTNVIFTDRDEFISLKSTTFEYQGESSLHHKVIAASRGFVYKTLDELVKQGYTQRLDAATESAVYELIIKGRVDAGIISRASLATFIEKGSVEIPIHISKQPHDVFKRRMLISRIQPELFQYVQHAILALDKHE